MKIEPIANRFSGPWYVIRQNDGHGVESYYWEENAIDAAQYLTRVEPNSYYVANRFRGPWYVVRQNNYYVDKLEDES